MEAIVLGRLECLTTAPEDYDYGWARTVQKNVATDDRGKVYRRVRNEDKWHFDQQVMRYESGPNPTITDNKDLANRIRLGFLTLTEAPVNVHYLTYDLKGMTLWREEVQERMMDGLNLFEKGEYGHSVKHDGFICHIRVEGDENRDKVVAFFAEFNLTAIVK